MIGANDQIRIGIVGCGFIANQKHLPSLRLLKNVSLVAFCDIIVERAEEARTKYGAPGANVYKDYKEMLDKEQLDVVHVCTPNRSHSFITVDALEAGCHVMCEKPMAINSAEAKKMIDAANRTGKTLSIGYQNRMRPEVQLLKQKVDEGVFGDIYYARALAIRRRGVPNWGVFLNEYEQGGGPLIDIGTHSLDLTLWMMNNYKPAICLGSTFKKMNREEEMYTNGKWDVNAFTVEDSAFGLVKMENGATISVESSWAINRSESIEAYTEFSGTKAGADMRGGVRIFGVRNGEWYVDVYPYDEYVAAMKTTLDHSDDPEEEIECVADAKQWIDALVTGKKPCVLPEQAYCVTRILEGIYESAKTGKAYIFD
ncbi:MAG: Gfo/Idh/MocA family oxidoreductase [Clostridia bacterium]|nr:Gfo/Idh/MocA family oxidoreductase [Clostridia bacterium]